MRKSLSQEQLCTINLGKLSVYYYLIYFDVFEINSYIKHYSMTFYINDVFVADECYSSYCVRGCAPLNRSFQGVGVLPTSPIHIGALPPYPGFFWIESKTYRFLLIFLNQVRIISVDSKSSFFKANKKKVFFIRSRTIRIFWDKRKVI